MFEQAKIPPRAALVLGAAGLLPTFIALCVIFLAPRPMQALAFRAAGAYAACILSFLGGAWWGIAAARGHPRDLPFWLGLSVLPALTGWAAVVYLAPLTMAGMGCVFLACLWVDHQLVRRFVAPDWWLALRLPLSLCMAGLHVFMAIVVAVKQ